MSDTTMVEFLSSVEILSAFSPAELEAMASAAEERFYKFGEAVCNAGDRDDGL